VGFIVFKWLFKKKPGWFFLGRFFYSNPAIE